MEQKNGYMRYFTKKSCYPNQAEAMEKIHSALLSEKIVLFEGACGTGKTLSALAPALHVGKKLNKVVIIVTNVHQQMVQFINEARDINRDNSIKHVLRARLPCVQIISTMKNVGSKVKIPTTSLILNGKSLQRKKNSKTPMKNTKKTKDPALYTLRNELEKELEEARKKAQSLRNHSCPRLYEVLRFEGSEFSSWLFFRCKESRRSNGICGRSGHVRVRAS
nr:DEAD/DEAH box helicase family protein [Methanosarcina horonobensis]